MSRDGEGMEKGGIWMNMEEYGYKRANSVGIWRVSNRIWRVNDGYDKGV